MIRSAVAAAFPLFTTQMFTKVRFKHPFLQYFPFVLTQRAHVDRHTMGCNPHRSYWGHPGTYSVHLFEVWSTYSQAQSVCTLYREWDDSLSSRIHTFMA